MKNRARFLAIAAYFSSSAWAATTVVPELPSFLTPLFLAAIVGATFLVRKKIRGN